MSKVYLVIVGSYDFSDIKLVTTSKTRAEELVASNEGDTNWWEIEEHELVGENDAG